ncbi:Hypothetical protein, putative, partial [Bodo saltans]
MTNVTSVRSIVSISDVFVEGAKISAHSCTMNGLGSTNDGSMFAILLMNTSIDGQSLITIADLKLQVAAADTDGFAGALEAVDSHVSDVNVSVVNVTCISPNTRVAVVLIQNTTVDGAIIAIDFVYMSGVTSSFAINLLSSVVAKSVMSATNVNLSTSSATGYVISVQYKASVPAPSRLINTSIVISNAHTASTLVKTFNVSITATRITVNHTVMSSIMTASFFAIYLDATSIAGQSLITLADLKLRMTSAGTDGYAGALQAADSRVGDVNVSVVNVTCISPNTRVAVVLIQNTTVDGAIIA